MNLSVGIFGSQELAGKLGKKGTTNDIAIYNHASSEGIFTFVCPNSDKVQTLLQTLNMIDVPVLVVKELTREIGEMILAIDEMNFQHGFIVTEIKDILMSVIKNTSLERFQVVDEAILRLELLKVKIERDNDNLLVPIDNYFDVKGIGTVVLGIVKSGIVNQYDKVLVEPLGKEVAIKNIQSQDNDVKEAPAGTRVGLNLKGVDVDELKRGYVVCKQARKSTEINIAFNKSKFFKQEVKHGMPVFLSVGLQVIACTVESFEGNLLLKASQPVAYKENQNCIVASQSDVLPRIIGNGAIL